MSRAAVSTGEYRRGSVRFLVPASAGVLLTDDAICAARHGPGSAPDDARLREVAG